jgi:hypothetical protein
VQVEKATIKVRKKKLFKVENQGSEDKKAKGANFVFVVAALAFIV